MSRIRIRQDRRSTTRVVAGKVAGELSCTLNEGEQYMNRAIVATGVLAVLAFVFLMSASTGWAKKKDVGSFSTTCLTDDNNLSKGATIAIKPGHFAFPIPRHRST